jgi:uncharacterized membrane protein YfhO
VPNALRLEVTADGPAYLMLAQYWYPGWNVIVDGMKQGAPLRTDYVFQGIPLDAGAHTVEVRFAPPLWRVGWVLAAAGWVLIIAGCAVAWFRRSQR